MGPDNSDCRHDPDRHSLVDCGTSLDITQAEHLCRQMRQGLEAGLPVVLTTAAVQRVDFVGIHLLSTFLEQAESRGLAVHWSELGRCLKEAASLVGRQHSLSGGGEA